MRKCKQTDVVERAAAAELPGNGRRKAERYRKGSVRLPAAPRAAEANSESEGDGEDFRRGVFAFSKRDILPREWFFEPWIARHVYTLLAGPKSAGKSTFGAFLASRAKKAIILPGEEDIRREVLPRFVAAGVNLKNVRWIPAGDDWQFPLARNNLIKLIEDWKAQFVFVDPFDSYVPDTLDEDKNLPVRRALDAFRRAAEATGAAIVLVRHPGKDKDNLLAGSRAFTTHPRAILKFTADPEDRYHGYLGVEKPPLGVWSESHHYSLIGKEGKPKKFVLGDVAPSGLVEAAADVTDGIERTRIDDAEEWIRRWLADGREMDSRTMNSLAKKESLTDYSMRQALKRIGVKRRRSGKGEEARSYLSIRQPR